MEFAQSISGIVQTTLGERLLLIAYHRKKISSQDNGRSFNSVVNLSNSTQTASEEFRIDAHGSHVAVFFWERAAAGGAKEQPAVRIR
jgi:hypothetical protein